jgi:hypothetical protein
MLEAVHSRQPIMLRLLLLAEREVEIPGQLLVTDPRLAGLPSGFVNTQPSVPSAIVTPPSGTAMWRHWHSKIKCRRGTASPMAAPATSW